MKSDRASSVFNYNVHGLLDIRSYSGGLVPDYFLSNNAAIQPDLTIERCKIDKELCADTARQIAPGLYYLEGRNTIISEIKLLGINATWSVENLYTKTTEVYFSSAYELLSKTLLKMPVSTVFPIKSYIQHLLHVKLLLKSHTFLVGGCIKTKEGAVILLSSMGGMGKTTSILKLLKEKGGEFLGDDMIIVDKHGTAWAYPKPLRIRKFNMSFLSLENYIPPEKIVGSPIETNGEINVIFLLERSNAAKIKLLQPQEALAKLSIINRKLLPYFMERTILAYSYADSSVNLYELMEYEVEILRSLTQKVPCYSLNCDYKHPNDHLKLMENILHGHN